VPPEGTRHDTVPTADIPQLDERPPDTSDTPLSQYERVVQAVKATGRRQVSFGNTGSL